MFGSTLSSARVAGRRLVAWLLASGGYGVLGWLVALAGVVALLAVPNVPRPLVPLGVLPGIIYYLVASRRERRRAVLLRAEFPSAARDVLKRRVAFYRQLDTEERRRFEKEVQVFLGEQRVYALNAAVAAEMTDEHRVLIAAGAATLLLGRPEWRLPTTRDIVVYPASFSEGTYEMSSPVSHTLGMVHAQGPILFSLPALLAAYPESAGDVSESAPHADPPEHNVAVHEFAHVLDFMGNEGRAGGLPGTLSLPTQARWAQQLHEERERLLAGASILDPYGLKTDPQGRGNDAELFAVAVEAFFQSPLRLRTLHPKLYDLLHEFFNQDPAERVVPRALWTLPWSTLWFGPKPSTRAQA